MAVQRYVLTADTTVPPGTAATLTPGEPGTGAQAGYGSAATTGGPIWPVTYRRGTVILLDPAGPLYGQIGAPNLRAWADTDAAGRPGISN